MDLMLKTTAMLFYRHFYPKTLTTRETLPFSLRLKLKLVKNIQINKNKKKKLINSFLTKKMKRRKQKKIHFINNLAMQVLLG